MNLRARREETFMIVYGREVFRRYRRFSFLLFRARLCIREGRAGSHAGPS